MHGSLGTNFPEHVCNGLVAFLLRYLEKGAALRGAKRVICVALEQKPHHLWFIPGHCEGQGVCHPSA